MVQVDVLRSHQDLQAQTFSWLWSQGTMAVEGCGRDAMLLALGIEQEESGQGM